MPSITSAEGLRVFDERYPGRMFFRTHLIEWDGELCRVMGAGRFSKHYDRSLTKARLVAYLRGSRMENPGVWESIAFKVDAPGLPITDPSGATVYEGGGRG